MEIVEYCVYGDPVYGRNGFGPASKCPSNLERESVTYVLKSQFDRVLAERDALQQRLNELGELHQGDAIGTLVRDYNERIVFTPIGDPHIIDDMKVYTHADPGEVERKAVKRYDRDEVGGHSDVEITVPGLLHHDHGPNLAEALARLAYRVAKFHKLDAPSLADPCEVERLREEIKHLRDGWYEDESDNSRYWPEQLQEAKSELADRDALLQDLLDYDISTNARRRIEEALSASPVPEVKS